MPSPCPVQRCESPKQKGSHRTPAGIGVDAQISQRQTFSWNFLSNIRKAVACCQQLHNTTLVTRQDRVQKLRQLLQHILKYSPMFDFQEVHKSSWESTARRYPGRDPRHQTADTPLSQAMSCMLRQRLEAAT